MEIIIPSRLSDDQLLDALTRLASHERHTTAALVAHLAEVDRRRLHLALGYRSLFEYCCEVLHLSEHAAYDRIEVARLTRRLPRVLELLAGGSIHLTAARLLAPHLTPDNHEGVLAEAMHKRKSEVEDIVARLAPRPDVRARIRAVAAPAPGRATPGAVVLNGGENGGSPIALEKPGVSAAGLECPEPIVDQKRAPRDTANRGRTTALAPERYEFRFTARRETRDRFRQAQDLLRHAVPDGDMGEIVDRALRLLIADTLRRKCAATERAGKPRRVSPYSRTVPAEVRRAVWKRDEGRCRFVGLDSRRCVATARLEFHHVKPWAVSGPQTLANIELRCSTHNRLEADRYFAASHDRQTTPQRWATMEPATRRLRPVARSAPHDAAVG